MFLLFRMSTGQRGQVLNLALIMTVLSLFVVVSLAALGSTAFRVQGKLQDLTHHYYAADASINAVIEDAKLGADLAPLPPNTYTTPSISFGELLPSVFIDVLETQTLASVKPISYGLGSNPTLVQGFNPQGGSLELSQDDNSYYSVTSTGDPSRVIYEVTSQVIEFPTVSFGEFRIIAQSSKSSTKSEIFVFNPNDPAHTDNGYNPLPDVTTILEAATTEQTISVFLSDADVSYLNSLSTKTLKVKIRAARTGGFRLDTDQILFVISGIVTTDERNVIGNPVIISGTLQSGSGNNLALDDTSYYIVSSVTPQPGQSLTAYEVTSDNFVFSTLDTVAIPLVVRSGADNTTLEMYVYNPTDPAHTDNGYSTTPDLTTVISLKNTDKTATLQVPQADITYLNTLSPVSMKVKVRAANSTNFQLELDLLVFIATSTSAPAQVVRQVTQQYIDPGIRNPYMAQIAAKEGYLLRIYNMHPGLMNVNWASHTPAFGTGKSTVLVFRGIVISSGAVVPPGRITSKPPSQGNDLVNATTSKPSESFARTGFVEVDRGLYTVVFFNESSSTLIAEPFAATGEKQDTWIYAPAYKDYLVDTRAESVGVRAVLRQIPGPTEPPVFPWATNNINWIENLVTIQSWEPYGVPPDELDDDEDGIQNKVDGTFSGSFVDESKAYSNNFTDQHLGGTTSGVITNRAGLTLQVKDSSDSSKGVLIKAFGSGGTATVAACSATWNFTSGTSATVTCVP